MIDGRVSIYELNTNDQWELTDELYPDESINVPFDFIVLLENEYAYFSSSSKRGFSEEISAVIVYKRNQNQWDPIACLESNNQIPANSFGAAMAANGNALVIGNPNEDLTGYIQGAVYVHQINLFFKSGFEEMAAGK